MSLGKKLSDGPAHRYGMVVDLDRCTGCGACTVACAVENNVAPGDPAVNERTSVSWLRVARVTDASDTRAAFVPLPCMQCGKKTPCVSVCPQKAVEVDASSGVVGQIPVRCLGCRYCMAACPYHARSFNWFDPVWPAEMKESLNPDVSTRTRGVVEKCNFCFHRLQAARAKAAAAGSRDVAPGDYVPACVEACPAGAIVFGDLGDPASEVSRAAHSEQAFRLLEGLGTDPKVSYTSSRAWVRALAASGIPAPAKEERAVDRKLMPRGAERMPLSRFLLALSPWSALLVFGLYGAFLCLFRGLNQTNMDNRFAFGLWIYLDLTVIALGAGAFFTGFLLYVMRRKELKAVINSAVVIGFVCYSGAVGILAIDVGQPLRAWFTFWHPNVHSMLTEVTFCITCYLTVLAVEYTPVVLANRRLRKEPALGTFGFELHHVMAGMAALGTFLSFFHQGSLGGLYGVMSARPFAFREAIGIWPTTFFLFVLSAASVGPSFILLTTALVEKISKKKLVKDDVPALLAKISGSMLVVYVLLKCVDTLVWINATTKALGAAPASFYSHGAFGTWILFAEIVLCGLLPALVLLDGGKRVSLRWRIPAAALACAGVALNRFVMTIQTQALPTLPFDRFLSYFPSWQESASFLAVAAYGVLVYAISFRYLNLFPQERELATTQG